MARKEFDPRFERRDGGGTGVLAVETMGGGTGGGDPCDSRDGGIGGGTGGKTPLGCFLIFSEL